MAIRLDKSNIGDQPETHRGSSRLIGDFNSGTATATATNHGSIMEPHEGIP